MLSGNIKKVSHYGGTVLLALALAACQSTPTAPPAPPIVPAVPAPPPAAKTPSPKPRIGLALGGGAARGFAHIGVIQVLEEAGLVALIKGYEGKRPHTRCRLTDDGRARFSDYLDTLEKVLRDAAQATAASGHGEATLRPKPA